MISLLARRTLAALSLSGLLLFAAAGPAAAHVTADSADPVGDGSVVLTFSFNHACAAAGTTGLSMQLPPGSVALAATAPPGWTGRVVGTAVEWSGAEIPSGQVTAVTVTARLAGRVGQALLFPTVQRCADGDGFDWSDADESGDEPAPRLVATAAVLDPALDTARAESGAGTLDVVVAIGLFALISGGAAVLWGRRRPRT